MSRVLLTGGRGFIGTHCASRLLKRGYEVIATTTSAPPPDAAGVDWRRVDLLDRESSAALVRALRPTHLLHLAWYTEHGKFYGAADNFRWVESSLGLLQEFVAAGGRRAVVAGTCAEYDWSGGVLSENDTPLEPATVYGLCKATLGRLFESLAGTAGISGAWARVFLLFGPGQPPRTLVPAVIRSLLAGEPALCSDGNRVRDYMYVEDVADALVAVLDSALEGPVNIASGESTTIGELVTRLAEKLGRPELVRLGARETPPDDPQMVLGDARRLRDELGWSPPIGLDAGLDRTIAWWRERLAVDAAPGAEA